MPVQGGSNVTASLPFMRSFLSAVDLQNKAAQEVPQAEALRQRSRRSDTCDQEAKAALLKKDQLADAMRQLFATDRIHLETPSLIVFDRAIGSSLKR